MPIANAAAQDTTLIANLLLKNSIIVIKVMIIAIVLDDIMLYPLLPAGLSGRYCIYFLLSE